jgi:hypothetical protein
MDYAAVGLENKKSDGDLGSAGQNDTSFSFS